MASQDSKQRSRIIREFLVTTFLLGAALLSAFLSTFFNSSDNYQLGVITSVLALLLGFAGGVYIVPKISRRMNFQLFNWRFSYSATTETAFFLVLTIIVGFAAVNTGNNLLYLVFSVLIAVLIASAIITEVSLRDIDVSLRFPENIFANEETNLDLSLINRKRFIPSFSLTVGVLTDEEEHPRDGQVTNRVRRMFFGAQPDKGLGKLAHYDILPGGGRLSQKIIYTFPQRGSYHIKGFMVNTKFPFGFLRKTHEKDATGEVVVYPQPQPLGAFSAILPSLSGWLESQQRGNGTDLYTLRQYYPQDNLRHIDWKATAKSRQLMVREFTTEDERRFTIIVDDHYDAELAEFTEKFERAIVLAASLADYFSKLRCEIRLLTPHQQTAFGAGPEHLYRMFRILALHQPQVGPLEEEEKQYKPINELVNNGENDFKVVITSSPSRVPGHSASIRVITLDRL